MFRWWHLICRVMVPLLFLTAVVPLIALRNQTGGAIAIAAFVVLLALGLVGGVMGIFLSRGTLRMRCPFCSRTGAVGVVSRGLALECPDCGLVYEAGFLKLRLVRQAPEMPEESHERTVENTPLELRSEMALFPRGWVYFRRWRTLRWYLLMLLVPASGLAAACWRGHIVGGCIVLVMSAVCGAIAFVFLNSGVSSSNWGTFSRSREPIRYWLDVALMAALYLGCSAGGWIIK
jgi:hypothetical protein